MKNLEEEESVPLVLEEDTAPTSVDLVEESALLFELRHERHGFPSKNKQPYGIELRGIQMGA